MNKKKSVKNIINITNSTWVLDEYSGSKLPRDSNILLYIFYICDISSCFVFVLILGAMHVFLHGLQQLVIELYGQFLRSWPIFFLLHR